MSSTPEQTLLNLKNISTSDADDVISDDALAQIQITKNEGKRVVEPFTESISAGKNTYVYDAHTYHTKVPPQGITRIIEHYTAPNEIVLDPFCGSGMTGVAALESGRQAILSDLSPAATFIAAQLCTPIDYIEYLDAVEDILTQSRDLERHLYGTTCRDCGVRTTSLYTVWSYRLICSSCGVDFVLWDVARDERQSVRESKIRKEFSCPNCNTHLKKRTLKRTIRVPVQIGYKCCTRGPREATAELDENDIKFLTELTATMIPKDLWYPTDRFPVGVNTRQPIAAGIDSIDKAYTPRALWAMAHLWKLANDYPSRSIREKLVFTLTSLYQRVTVFSEFRFWGGSGNTANYNVPQIMNEQNVFAAFRRKANTISWYFRDAPKVQRRAFVSTTSACNLRHISDKSIDFVFTDPPFGSNINYSEMNFLWESWLRKFTDPTDEAIVSRPQGKENGDYQALLTKAFSEVHRVLKDHSWMCVVFHNSSEKVWQALQLAIDEAGFVVRAAQSFDKQHGTFKMFVSSNTVGYDLVLHCQKRETVRLNQPQRRVALKSKVYDFVRQRLASPTSYRVTYLHVSRKTEFDYRKLYSEWLCESISGSTIDIDFEGFRKVVDAIRSEESRNDA